MCSVAGAWLPAAPGRTFFWGVVENVGGGEALMQNLPDDPYNCPYCTSTKDVYHRLKASPCLTIPICILDCTFLEVYPASSRVATGRLCTDHPQPSLSRAQGLRLCKTA